jgi:hypothetical protein
MKRIYTTTLILLGFAVFAFSQTKPDYSLEITGKPDFYNNGGIIKQTDSFEINFNIYRNKGKSDELRSLFITNPEKLKIGIREQIGDQILGGKPEYLKGSFKILAKEGEESYIPEDITISILIDRSGSILEHEMELIRQAVKVFIQAVPDSTVYLSWFHSYISTSVLATKSNADGIVDELLTRTSFDTDLYNAIYAKIIEFDSNGLWPNATFENEYDLNPDLANRATTSNYLIILTDGQNDVKNIPKSSYEGFETIDEAKVFQLIDRYKDKVQIFTLGYGAERGNFDEDILKKIAAYSGNPNGYFFAKPDSVVDRFRKNIVEQLTNDYRIQCINAPNKRYTGKQKTLFIELEDDSTGIKAIGSVNFSAGSQVNPIETGKVEEAVTVDILKGLLIGILLVIIVLIIIQLIWPLIRNKIFSIRYVHSYKPASNELARTCPYCYDPINPKDKVVEKCKHVVHLQCWNDSGHVCPEYPQNCIVGKQNYFDIKDPFSRKNKMYYLNWVLFGLIGGFFTWVTYILIKEAGFFQSIAEVLVNWFAKKDEDAGSYIMKIYPLMNIGLFMGFWLTLLFAYVEEYRRLTFVIFLKILLRGIFGSFTGLLSFILGSIILILAQKPTTTIWFDWIPWLFFGALIGLGLSVRTTIHWKHGLFGGAISILFSFFILSVVAGDLGFIAVLISFMLYGAGLGVSIATIRSTSEHYFLKILNGTKEGTMIAVHKWMSSQGGLNEVYIGKQNVCEVQMNWEKGFDVAEKHAKLYINKSRKIPVLVSLQKGKSTLYDERLEMMVGKEYDLLNLTTFKIGETVFQYVEKDN